MYFFSLWKKKSLWSSGLLRSWQLCSSYSAKFLKRKKSPPLFSSLPWIGAAWKLEPFFLRPVLNPIFEQVGIQSRIKLSSFCLQWRTLVWNDSYCLHCWTYFKNFWFLNKNVDFQSQIKLISFYRHWTRPISCCTCCHFWTWIQSWCWYYF